MKLTWLGHSCFLLETASGSVVFDPYAPQSVPGLSLPPLTADAVLCSHGHRDHNYAQAVRLSGKKPSFSVRRMESFHDDQQGALRGENLISIVEAEGMRVVHLGDLGVMPDAGLLDALKKADLLMIPVGGYYTIDAKTALALVKELSPRIVVPMHYRGAGFGYDVIAEVDEFAGLSENPVCMNSAVLEFDGNTPSMTALLRLSGNC